MPEAGKVTVGLASHWSCVTNSSGLSTYGLNGHEWEMSTPPTPQLGHGSLYLFTFTTADAATTCHYYNYHNLPSTSGVSPTTSSTTTTTTSPETTAATATTPLTAFIIVLPLVVVKLLHKHTTDRNLFE